MGQAKAESTRGATARSVLAVGATILTTLFVAVAAGAAPRDPARVAAVFPPWWTSAQAASAAASAGQIAGAGGAPFILILRGEPGQLGPRLRAAGAWLLLDPAAAGRCAPSPEPR
uniref:Uncharacterized protein n=1 Tax=Caulobacter sp. (strain K31) TaxID=366602 RepID=B0SZ82_CAUSK